MRRSRVVVCLSGGPDSVLCAEFARDGVSSGFPTELAACFFLDYGQPVAAQELEAASRWCTRRDVPLYTGRTDLMGMAEMRGEAGAAGARVVPGRNGIIVALALNVAAGIEAHEVWFGAIRNDAAGYLDCTPEWVEREDALAQRGFDPPLRVRAPLLNCTKVDVLADLLRRDVLQYETWSCYAPISDGHPCGTCDSCRLIAHSLPEAFRRLDGGRKTQCAPPMPLAWRRVDP